MLAVGVDVGGTNTRVGVVDQAGRILTGRRYATPEDGSGDEFVHVLSGMVDQVVSVARVGGADVQVVGVALPGIVDRQHGILVRSVNLPNLESRPIRDEFARKLERPVFMTTDAEAATWGEYTALEEPPHRFVHLRLGTGIACGAVIEGVLQRLDKGRTTHLPVLVVDQEPNAKPCHCGLTGCLETVASGSALLNSTKQAGCGNDLRQLQAAWEAGARGATEIVDQAAAGLAVALDNLVECFQPEVISLGGGVLDQLPCLIDAAMPGGVPAGSARPAKTSPSVSIKRSRRGDDAGVIGAALLALQA